MTVVSPVEKLLTAVREGRHQALPALLASLDPAGRKAALARLKELRTEIRGWEWGRWQERLKVGRGLIIAGAGCHTGAAAAAAWLGARDLRQWDRLPTGILVEVLSGRDSEWLGDVAHRLAARASTGQEDYPFIRELVRIAGCPVPTTDAFVHGWAGDTRRAGLLRELRKDPHLADLVPRLFETVELPRPLAWSLNTVSSDQWPSVLVTLSEEGLVERSLLVDRTVARLLRGGRAGDLKFFLALLQRLALTPQEERERIADWIGMASDAPSTVAAHAQAALARLSESGDLPARALAEVSGPVLFRTEKKLVRAQLVLLGKALRRDPAGAAELLPVLAEAFGHEDTGVQERALKLVGRHLSAVDDALRSELADAASLLSPAHRESAVEVFGEALVPTEEPVPYEEHLPPAPGLRRLEPAAASVAELVEQLVVVLRSADVSAFERTLDGLVRHAYQDAEALAAALRGALADRWWIGDSAHWSPDERFSRDPDGLEVVAAAVLGRVSVTTLHNARTRPSPPYSCAHAGLSLAVNARLWEAAYYVRTRPLPFLLATPTWHTGALDPEELVERLRAYQRLGVTPGPADFGQALLRVERNPAVAPIAAELGTVEGERLAAWLSAAEPLLPALRSTPAPADGSAAGAGAHGGQRVTGAPDTDRANTAVPAHGRSGAPTMRNLLAQARERRQVRREFPPALRWLGREPDASGHACYHWVGDQQYWPAVLPQDRDILASWLLPGVRQHSEYDTSDGTWWLSVLAEAGGEAGPALHRALAYGLGARNSEARLVAVDALLVLAARGELDAGRLGGDLAELVADGTVKPNRLADAARTAAATGAYATVWSVLGAALSGLLCGDTLPRGLGEILAIAADCVERCGASGAVPGLTEAAGRRGSSQLVVQAKRLLAALGQQADHSTPQPAEISH